MTSHRSFAVVAVWSALVGTYADTVYAQVAPATRGTVKVRPRFFNPFDVNVSRLTLNPFGIFAFVEPSGTSAAAASTTATTSAALTVLETSGSSDPGIATNAVRPPYRPPFRSPWRPPPRPPFFPP